LKKVDPGKLKDFTKTFQSETRKKFDLIKYNFEWSLASAVLKVAKLLPTNHSKLLSLQDSHQQLAVIMNVFCSKRTEEQARELPGLLRKCMKEVCASADMILTTTTLAASRYVKPFTRDSDVAALDEASSSSELENLVVQKGDKPVILVDDPEQLPRQPSQNFSRPRKVTNTTPTLRRRQYLSTVV
jgi:hypothetical protein